MIRKKRKFDWPRKLYDKPRILAENKLVTNYGLKNKKEIWKTEAKIKYFRNRAKLLITAPQEEQQIFFNKLKLLGLKVNTIADVLALNTEELLKRRLSTIAWKKGLANTPKQARQLIVHKKVLLNDKIMNVPGYYVKLTEEENIKLKPKTKKVKTEEKPEEEKAEEKTSQKEEPQTNE